MSVAGGFGAPQWRKGENEDSSKRVGKPSPRPDVHTRSLRKARIGPRVLMIAIRSLGKLGGSRWGMARVSPCDTEIDAHRVRVRHPHTFTYLT